MTTNDIKEAQIAIIGKNGEVLIGNTSDKILINMIASYVKFVQVDENRFLQIPIKEIAKRE